MAFLHIAIYLLRPSNPRRRIQLQIPVYGVTNESYNSFYGNMCKGGVIRWRQQWSNGIDMCTAYTMHLHDIKIREGSLIIM